MNQCSTVWMWSSSSWSLVGNVGPSAPFAKDPQGPQAAQCPKLGNRTLSGICANVRQDAATGAAIARTELIPMQHRKDGAMTDEDNVIDVEAEDIPDSPSNLPAVIPKFNRHQTDAPIKGPSARYAAGEREFDRPAAAEERDWETYAEPSRRCAGHKKTGEQCKNAAILGSTVCRFHGGAAPHVKAAARARLENAADLMAKQLLGIALTADSDGVKLAAIKDALDRAGLRPPAEVVLSQGETKPWEELFDGMATMSRAESRRARGVSDAHDDLAGVDRAHSRASSQEGTECQSFHPPTSGGPGPPNQPAETPLRRKFRDPTTDGRDIDRERQPQPPVTGASALRVAADLARQKAITSPHKRYPRP